MEKIPPGTYSYRMDPQFVTHWREAWTGSEWLVFGPVETVRSGSVIQIRDRHGKDHFVTVLEQIAERTVNKRDSTQVIFTLATFDRCVEEE